MSGGDQLVVTDVTQVVTSDSIGSRTTAARPFILIKL